jgi:hypothetical protein
VETARPSNNATGGVRQNREGGMDWRPLRFCSQTDPPVSPNGGNSNRRSRSRARPVYARLAGPHGDQRRWQKLQARQRASAADFRLSSHFCPFGFCSVTEIARTGWTTSTGATRDAPEACASGVRPMTDVLRRPPLVAAVCLLPILSLRARRETNESSASEERRNRIANALGAPRARKAILGG